MKVIFMGTPDFAVPVLQGLIDSKEHEVVAVVTQPDKARGRSGKLTFTPVKQVALEHDIPVYIQSTAALTCMRLFCQDGGELRRCSGRF